MQTLRPLCGLLVALLFARPLPAADLYRVWLDGDPVAYGRVVGGHRTILAVKDKFADLLVDESEAASLRSQGLRVEFVQKDPEGFVRSLRTGAAQAGYHRYDAMVEALRELQRAHPELVRLEDCGDSWEKGEAVQAAEQGQQGAGLVGAAAETSARTEDFRGGAGQANLEAGAFQPRAPRPRPRLGLSPAAAGHDIWAVRLHSERAERLSKPALLLLGGIHARELASTEVVLRLIRWLAESYEKNPEVQALLETRRVWAIPLLNPDGREYVFETDPWWRKNRHRHSGAGNIGVDLNRNFPFFWSSELGASTVPSSAVYHGVMPLSEPETQALVALVDRVHPTASLSFHSYGQYALVPFGYPVRLPDDSGVIRTLGAMLGESTGYQVGTVGQLLGYWSSGRHDDWMYGSRGVMAFELELGRTFFPERAELEELGSVAGRATSLLARACGSWPEATLEMRIPHSPSAVEALLSQSAQGQRAGDLRVAEVDLVFRNRGVDDAIQVRWELDGSGAGAVARPASGVVALVPGLRRARQEPVRVPLRLSTSGETSRGELQVTLVHDGCTRRMSLAMPSGAQPTE